MKIKNNDNILTLSNAKNDRRKFAIVASTIQTLRKRVHRHSQTLWTFPIRKEPTEEYADASAILELWESLELPCSPQLLEVSEAEEVGTV
ncbi:hypothetical protein TNCT_572471 [Trichonephila clavata]|uniref:Uncharacterized protein n=1 Tax=Trichonephila clavata TaxID=2740835 RepID=A0A8X6GV73_TRICU|nr:hypothetical protein TNCT_572471 [Trichonephila clavata]